jgi:hypothetical protein
MRIINVQENRHLTATEKKAIVAIIKAGLDHRVCQVGKKTYSISKTEVGYKVVITENQTNMFGKMVEVSHSATFNIA